MAGSLSEAAAGAVRTLQRWYAADAYAESTGLYHWDAPSLSLDLGAAAAALVVATGYRDAAQDQLRWWNSANAITAVIDHLIVTGDRTYLSAVEGTFRRGPTAWHPDPRALVGWTLVGAGAGAIAGGAAGLAMGGPLGGVAGALAGVVAGGLGVGAGAPGRVHMTGFRGQFFDDEAWWALAWMRAHDLTGDPRYLEVSGAIFDDMTTGWDTVCGGGIYWQRDGRGPDGKPSYKNAIANELFLAVATGLLLRRTRRLAQNGDPDLRAWADRSWAWLRASGLMTGSGLINDSFSADADRWSCENREDTPIWSYNQGVILGGLCDLFEITGDRAYLTEAERIADAFLGNPVDAASTPPRSGVDAAGILTEFTDPNPSYADVRIDCRQFKGIFMRNLAKLWSRGGRKERYAAFIAKNAASAVAHMNASCEVGARWSAPVDTADFVRQTAAVDLLNAALVVQAG